jgi:hypothetical protein
MPAITVHVRSELAGLVGRNSQSVRAPASRFPNTNPYVPFFHIFIMTSEITGGNDEIFDADAHEQEVKKSYYHTFDDEDVRKLKHYYNVPFEEHNILLRYLKDHRVPTTTPNDL